MVLLTPPPRGRATAHPQQRGIALLFALMALVILSLGAVALTRSVDTSTLVMGNLSFRQDAVVTASAAAEQAVGWLEARRDTPALNTTDEDQGYYSSSIDTLDPTGNRTSAARKLPVVDWNGDGCKALAAGSYEHCNIQPFTGNPVNENRVQWVIIRLCEKPNQPAAGSNFCIRPAANSSEAAVDRGELQAGGRITRRIASPYYRIIVRVQGPRNTVSTTESLVHF